MIRLAEPYRPRLIRPIGLWEIDDWKMKAYGIAYEGQQLEESLIESAWKLAKKRLHESAHQTNHYGVGFVGVHQSKTSSFFFVDWWADENELHHHVYATSSKRQDEFRYLTPSGLIACAWELSVLCFEREAWIKHVLQGYPEPDVDAYLKTVIDTIA
ncbi:hypothetical protein ACFPTY_03390 [Halomonas beimenensis]|uniref:isochorismatase n=1 Tax=Halomonas beimenensis TaxID=475662 RepID=UPI000BEF1AA8|nr:isochorismatase [Halomonas beimenensis]